MRSHSQHVEQCTWDECLIEPAEDVVTELRFSSMGLDSCHHTFFFMPHSEALLNETFVLVAFILSRMVHSPTYPCICLLDIYLWF